jgi:para-nitrobenzyl esterase
MVDGLTIPHPPERMIEEGIVNNIPLLIGTNKDEAKSFDFVKPNQTNSKEYILNTLFGKNGPAVIEAYNKACMVKAEDDAWYEILTDYLYRMASTRLAARLADRGNPVWMYRFDFQGSSGAVHGAEMVFIWNDCITSIIPPSGESLAKKMHNAWISFIRTGNPQTEEFPLWKPYTSSECKTMLFDTNCSAQALNRLHENSDFPMQMIIL